jgi:hypothetical protein
MFGAGNVEEHVLNKAEGTTTGVGLRAYDPKTARWAIWWMDGRDPHGAPRLIRMFPMCQPPI